jgi:hypothetical protein
MENRRHEAGPFLANLPDWKSRTWVRAVYAWNSVCRIPAEARVNFVVAGAQKAGTSALATYLKTHPEISMATRKEVQFFDRSYLFSADGFDPVAGQYDQYHRHFRWKNPRAIRGEVSPQYLGNPDVAERLAAYNPQLKVVILLRNPADRFISMWKMERRKERHETGLVDLLQKRKGAAYMGGYGDAIRRFRSFFSDDQLLWVKYEDFRANQSRVLGEIQEFLGCKNTLPYADRIERNAYHSSLTISGEELQVTRAYFAKEVERVEELLGWDCTDWKA